MSTAIPKFSYELREHPIAYMEVSLDKLLVSERAQRELEGPRVLKLAKELIPSAVGTIIVSQRISGEMYIVDGQHRHAACMANGITTLTAEVHFGLTEQEEAVLFLLKNRESKKPKAIDEYRVALAAKLPLFVEVNETLAAHGLNMGTGTSTNTVGAVNAVLSIADKYGTETLDRVLTVAETSWRRSADTWDGVLLGGLGTFIGRHGDKINDEELAKRLAKRGDASQWRGMVSFRSTEGGKRSDGSGGRLSACYYLLLVEWNKRRSAANRIEP